jgi:hypothetical protein
VVITGALVPVNIKQFNIGYKPFSSYKYQPSNVGVCVSNPATFGIVASGDGLTYQWYKGTIGSGVRCKFG